MKSGLRSFCYFQCAKVFALFYVPLREELLLLYDKHQSNIILGDVIPAPLTPPSPLSGQSVLDKSPEGYPTFCRQTVV
jgi:hypothetical protein